MKLVVGCLVRTVSVILYVLLGSVMFLYIENSAVQPPPSPDLNETSSALNELRNKYSCQLHNISDEELKSLAKAIIDITSAPDRPKLWTFEDALQLVFETVTTIGYGSNVPTIGTGRILLIFYALVGIPLYLYCLQILGKAINKVVNKTICFVENKGLKIKEPKNSELKCLVGFVVILAIYILLIAVVASEVSGWSYGESIYVLFITFTTIGFGDFVIRGRSIVITALGMCLMSGLFDAILCYHGCLKKKASDMEASKLQGKKSCCFGKHNNTVLNESTEGQYKPQNISGTTELSSA